LRDLGYVEGRNVLIEYRWAEGKYDRFPALIGELLALKVAVIVTAGTPATLAVKKATTSVPLVMLAVGDPVGTGIVPSLSLREPNRWQPCMPLFGGRESTPTILNLREGA
jgi:putative ABC transport system substrate-binding protein